MNEKKECREKTCYDIIVVGAGAAGLMAAIQAARSGARVLVLEHMERPGKKLLMTGNGKCNFTNELLMDLDKWQDKSICETYYHGACPAFVLNTLRCFNVESTLNFFGDLGIVNIQRRGGYYPSSGQASAILAVLLMECRRLGVVIECNIGIRSITKAENNCINKKFCTDIFILDTKNGIYSACKCILATGGKSYKKTGSDGSGFLYIERLGHHIQDLVPALVPLQSNLAFFKKVAGIRAEIKLKIYIDGTEKACESGELQLTDYGISGICVFQLSHIASRALKAHQRVVAELDFLPQNMDDETFQMLWARCHHPYAIQKTMEESLNGLFSDRLGKALLEETGIAADQLCNSVSEHDLLQFVHMIKHFCVPIFATRSFEQAQVTAGGVDTSEVFADTLESKLVPGLYFAGEMLDVDGICGGFNLQWAWSSGALAGKSAAADITGSKNK